MLALLNGAKQGYEEALAQAAADSRAAIEASMAARNAVSEQPPCNSDELREYLDYWLCQIEFINPVSTEQEADNPGITATIDEYVAEVCEAVSLECVQEA